MVGTAERLDDHRIEERFSGRTAEFMHDGNAAYVARVEGKGITPDGINLNLFTELIPALARTPRWIVSSLFGPGGDPGFRAAHTHASLVVHFTLPEYEVSYPSQTGDIQPTVEASRYVASLLSVSRDEDQLLERVSHLRQLAVQRYSGTLELLAKNDSRLTGSRETATWSRHLQVRRARA